MTSLYQRWRQARGMAANPAARIICNVIKELFTPKTVLDVGCGDGSFLREFPDSITYGVDQHPYDFPHGFQHYHKIDLEGFYKLPKADLALCLETAEHLSVEAGKYLVNRLCESSPVVVFGAAIPFQGGYGHKNEQWQSYWAELFAWRRYQPYDYLRKVLWNANVPPWYPQNTLVYCEPGTFAGLQLASPVSVVHPGTWAKQGIMSTLKRLIHYKQQ